MLRTGQSPAPSTGRSTSASTPGSHPTPRVLLPGTLGSPRTGLAPAGCRELVARLRRAALLSVVLGARATGRTFLRNLVELGAIDAGLEAFLAALVRARKNLIIAGGTGAGKTTM